LKLPARSRVLEAKNLIPMIPRIALIGLLTAGALQAESFSQTRSETHPFDPRGRVRIEDANGSISVKGWDRPEVSIQVEKKGSSEEYVNEIRVDIDASPQSLSIKTVYPHRYFGWLWGWHDHGQVRITVTAPVSAELERVATVNGAVTIDGIGGPIEAEAVNGGIHATGLRGTAKLTTVNGSIHAEVGALDPAARLNLETVNGSIVVLLPKDAGATVNASTINGRISCDLPVHSTETGFVLNKFTGVIGAGGGSIRATTVNGSVRLQAL
jgi:DUF4097 and DUF4098 domain-containing protein YvlB